MIFETQAVPSVLSKNQTFFENKIDYRLFKIAPDGNVTHEDRRSNVKSEHSDGMFGVVRVLEEDAVVKGTCPSSSVKHFARLANWRGYEFPSQVDERAAKMDFLTSKLLHLTLPTMSGGKFYSPDALGYTKLSDGYAQVLEKVSGRGPCYTDEGFDYPEFKQAQKELRELEYRLGFEHGAQVDEENPLGLPNIWRDDKNDRWIHMDTLPAFRHVPTFGVFRFKFHQKAKEFFYPENSQAREVTYNRLHTFKFLEEIWKKKDSFEEAHLKEILQYALQYEEIRTDFEINYHPKRLVGETVKQFALGSKELLWNGVTGIGHKAIDFVHGIVNPYHQQKQLFEGMEKALDEGQITEEQYDASEEKFNESLFRKGFFSRARVFGLGLTYAGIGAVTHIPEFYLYAQIGQNIDLSLESLILSTIASGATFCGARVAGGVLRYPATHVFGFLTRTDLSTAAKTSLIPVVGDNIALIAQLQADHKGDKLLTHYAIRNLLADVSTIVPLSWRKPFPFGGWGTDAEAATIRRWGKKLEHLIENS